MEKETKELCNYLDNCEIKFNAQDFKQLFNYMDNCKYMGLPITLDQYWSEVLNAYHDSLYKKIEDLEKELSEVQTSNIKHNQKMIAGMFAVAIKDTDPESAKEIANKVAEE